MFKIVVEVEAVSVLHVFPSGIFIKYASFPTCQGLQRAFQLTLLWGNNETIHWALKQKLTRYIQGKYNKYFNGYMFTWIYI